MVKRGWKTECSSGITLSYCKVIYLSTDACCLVVYSHYVSIMNISKYLWEYKSEIIFIFTFEVIFSRFFLYLGIKQKWNYSLIENEYLDFQDDRSVLVFEYPSINIAAQHKGGYIVIFKSFGCLEEFQINSVFKTEKFNFFFHLLCQWK